MYHKIVVGACVLAAVAIGEAPQAPIEVIDRNPGLLPPVLIFPLDGDVNGDGKLTEVDLTTLKAGGEAVDGYLRAFNAKLEAANKARELVYWIRFEKHRMALEFLARSMVKELLELKEGEALILLYWGGETTATWSLASGDKLRAIRSGRSCFRPDPIFPRWEYVDAVPAVPLDPAKRPTS